jgi:hypothetical protein
MTLGGSVSFNLEAELDPRFNRIERRVQRVGWAIIALVLVAAVLGLFGGGFFSQATARDRGEGYELALRYPRLGRAESNLELELRIAAPGQSSSEVMAVFSGEIVDKASFTGIAPQPDSETVDGDSIVYTWEVEDWSQPLVVRFEYEARDWRMLDGRFEVSAGDESLGSVSFDQFLFP